MTTTQAFWDEIATGTTLPELVKVPTPMQLFMFSAVTWNRHLIHYNTEFALSDGLRNVAVHRALIGGFLAQMLADWVGERGSVATLEWSVRGSAAIEQPLTLGGTVTGKRELDRRRLVDCEIWAQNHEGQTIAPGTATLALED
jgi:hydroxyacyl-ACP dehydratase HTD2-like protein with hotdog domain